MNQLATPDRPLEMRKVALALLEDGRISQGDANLLAGTPLSEKQRARNPLSVIAARKLADPSRKDKPLDGEQLSRWLAERSNLDWVNIDPLEVNVARITEVMSFAFAQRHKILCVAVKPDELVVATAEPHVNTWVEQLTHTARKGITKVIADPDDIDRYTVEFYALAKSISGVGAGSTSAINNFEQLLEVGAAKDPEANDQHIVNIVDWLLQYAFEQRASDIHIEPRRTIGRVRFRIDGVLHQVYELPMNVTMAVTSRLKVLGRMNVAEKRKPQDGRIKTKSPDGNEVELRLSTLPTAFGEKMVMRIFDPDVLLRSFEQLGLVGDDLAQWQAMLAHPNGIVLVTGPTGSGKTTTLYSSLKRIATDQVNVSTIEDPIEMVEDAFNQTQVQHNIGLDFAAGVRTLMRQDPDIIMVGEIRDLETAEMAIQASLTGHLVLSTLHTNDAPAAVARLVDLGVPAYLIKSAVLGVMAQRLVRTLCPHCKAPQPVDEAAWQQLVSPWKAAAPAKIYQPVGCLECRNTGYLGRVAIYEIMMLTDAVKSLIKDDGDLMVLRKQAVKEGMRTLRMAGAQKVGAGLTTIEEVMRVAPAPDKD
ncbi:GspE/PulE family protein [Simiduia aestuariiviva]|uniref:General secretion pathway protein E n=1 Tax=Simiduia aestuariiviva TaxID=1510459 RepID=A0A839UX27_9GAMM|nr:GspE/PulE family protein [Simiduia aestuariiviva]MBB3170008.1 general secretion pathway protein E [Simiduia aestuariiviva]